MQLSIIIVNYNVKYFLQQCLTSVFNALKKVDAEVWVVDNNSVDGSVAMVQKNFPQVKLIANKDNVGFSKANNQAIRKSVGKYVLLLNPDTLVEETTFEKIVAFMDSKPNAGGLGVNMIDGKGKFLPESKRGIPTPIVAFYKMFGLTRIFKKSKRFAKYYMGHLDQNETNKVEILSGAFMLLRKSVLDEIGLLDEAFFMYGEDIDLSYRILKGGYDNYYFADTKIVHYKGESTKKGSLNYVYVFYNAMIIFAKKHFAKSNANLFFTLIKIAIFFRAGLAIMKRLWKALYLPILDAAAIFGGFYFFIVPIWGRIKFDNPNYYPDFIWFLLCFYILIWIITNYFSGGYENPLKVKKVFVGVLVGTLIILVFYALIDLKFRFSRAIILIGAGYALTTMLIIRTLLHVARKYTKYSFYSSKNSRLLIVGDIQEAQRVENILNQISLKIKIIGSISPNSSNNTLGNLNQIEEIVKINKIDEVIFCAKNLSAENIINKMLKLSSLNVNVKIAPEDSISIIGSNSINTAGDLYTLDINTITKTNNKRNKNVLDKLLSILFLTTYIFSVWFVKNKLKFLRNIFTVFIGKKSWVGFYENEELSLNSLPKIKKGVLTPVNSTKNAENLTNSVKQKLNVSYAKNYQVRKDLFIIFKGFRELGS